MKYLDFLLSKVVNVPDSGLTVSKESIHPSLFPHQRDIVHWALNGGRRAIFAQFGLGKSLMQLEIATQITFHTDGKFLIIAPLAVIPEFKKDGLILGLKNLPYVRTQEEVEACKSKIMLTNYERVRDGDIDPNHFIGVSLDEASVLRGYGTKTYQTFLQIFTEVPYRFVATATPSPNRYKELIHYAGFLGIMDTGQALTRFFQRNSQKANDLTLYPHKEQEFWFWVSSWAAFLFKPSDLGYNDKGYDLPEIKFVTHRLAVDHESAGADSWGNVKMFRDAAVSLQDAAREKRESLLDRVRKVREIVNQDPDAHWLIWHDLESERKELEKEFSAERKAGQFKSVYGSQDLEERESSIREFGDGGYRILATKPVIAGSGCNFQRYCHKAIFMGIGFKFNDFIQAVHRIHRFLQDKPVEVHLIFTESEDQVFQVLMEKKKKHEELVTRMREIIMQYGLSKKDKLEILKRTIGCDRQEVKGEFYTSVNNDCVQELPNLAENSVDMVLTSIPFGTQYEYCPSYNDFGHNSDNRRFWEQMDFLIPELARVTKPGRIMAIHVKDRIRFGNVTGNGVPTVDRFSDQTADAFEKHGLFFMGRITVVTDVVRENNQTYRLGWSENAKDSTKMGVGMPEYVLLFRKPQTDLSKGYADSPVTKDKSEYTRGRWQVDAHAFWRSSGNRLLTPAEWSEMEPDRVGDIWKDYSERNVYDFDYHIAASEEMEKNGRLPASFMLFAPPSHNEWVWTDILRMLTLNNEQSRKAQENHVCPLQLDLVRRLIERYTNSDELVLDPFGGLMTVPFQAVKLGRRGYGIELNPEYWANGNRYLYEAEYKRNVPTLFDQLEIA